MTQTKTNGKVEMEITVTGEEMEMLLFGMNQRMIQKDRQVRMFEERVELSDNEVDKKCNKDMVKMLQLEVFKINAAYYKFNKMLKTMDGYRK